MEIVFHAFTVIILIKKMKNAKKKKIIFISFFAHKQLMVKIVMFVMMDFIKMKMEFVYLLNIV